MAISPLHAKTDPYRSLFHQLSCAVAHGRLILEDPAAVRVEILDSNAAFAPLLGVMPELLGLCGRVRNAGRAETAQVRTDAAVLSVTVYPVGGDDVMLMIEDATARVHLEEQVTAVQGRFDQVFHGNAAAMVIADRTDLRIIDVNPRWLEMFGATREEVIGRTSVGLGLIDEARAQERIVQHRRFADGYDVELELRTRVGAELIVLASARPIEIAEGPCTLTTLLDITARKHAEEAFAKAFSASPAGMVLVDASGDRVAAVNDRLLALMRRSREELIGCRASELFWTNHPPRAELLDEIERHGRLNNAEVELARRGGPGVWTLASTEQITLQGKPHRLTVFTDLTERKRAERRIVTQHRIGLSLAESATLEVALPPVVEALCRSEGWSCGAVWLPGAEPGPLRCHGMWRDGSVSEAAGAVVASPSIEALLARVRTTGAIQTTALDAIGSNELDAAELPHVVAFPILRGSAVLGGVVLAAHDGHEALDAAASGVFQAVGRLLGLFIERVRAETSLRELNSELERRVRERTQALEASNRDLEAFSSSVSHDLRAPLRAIQGFAEILLEDFAAELPAKARDLLGRIHAGGRRLRDLVEDLLDFSRLGRADLRRVRVDLDAMVHAVVDELQVGRALGSRLALRVEPLGMCAADPSLLRTVWMNLIDNALKYARTRERISIEIGRDARDGEIFYYVRDNGVGFDMAYADRLFGVFQRLHAASDFEGTGIGLANVRRIVERHRGRITAVSELGHGASFAFSLGEAERAAAEP